MLLKYYKVKKISKKIQLIKLKIKTNLNTKQTNKFKLIIYFG